ncbi:MAG TPA: dihydropyrimidinase [Solirubrobacter sp.]|nr:dihydropyrimidinase [Solirubrobacter sp.]
MSSVLIRGGRVVTAAGEYDADVLVEHGRITAIGEALASAGTVIDAEGLLVMPGGVDPHTHIDLDEASWTTADDFTVATAAAAAGGTTCVVDFAMQEPGRSFPDTLAKWHGKLERTPPLVDVGFHVAVTDLRRGGTLSDLAELAAQGVTSFKLFMAYKGDVMVDDETLFRTLEVGRREGCLTLVHAENGDVIDVLVKRALAAGHVEPRWHAATRPPLTEAEATARAITLARLAGAPLYVVHVSCREALEPIVAARRAGAAVWGETCPQYLVIDEAALDREDGAKYVFTPPPRTLADREALWRALARRELQSVGSDHCPYQYATEKAPAADFSLMPNGAPGIEHRMQVLWELGVRAERLTASDLVDLCSTTPARLFGLYPRKGTIAVGSDADLVLWDPEREVEISAATHRSRADYSIYEGLRVHGGARTVLVRGRVVVDDGDVVGDPGDGRFVARDRVPAGKSAPQREITPTG